MSVGGDGRSRPIDGLIGMLVAARHEMGQLREPGTSIGRLQRLSLVEESLTD